MKKVITAVVVALAFGLAGCGTNESTEPSAEVTSTTSQETTTSPSKATTTTSTEASTKTAAEIPVDSTVSAEPAPASQAPAAAPPRPPFMSPEDYDPYGTPKFVQCWESNAAVMSDGSIVTDTVNCAPDPVQSQPGLYEDPPRADGCVGPAATCGYYDENGNPVWFDKQTLETSPRYFDEFGNPTMEPN